MRQYQYRTIQNIVCISTLTKEIRTAVVNGCAHENVVRDIEGLVEHWLTNILFIHVERVVFGPYITKHTQDGEYHPYPKVRHSLSVDLD